jgi:hypothetical protein
LRDRHGHYPSILATSSFRSVVLSLIRPNGAAQGDDQRSKRLLRNILRDPVGVDLEHRRCNGEAGFVGGAGSEKARVALVDQSLAYLPVRREYSPVEQRLASGSGHSIDESHDEVVPRRPARHERDTGLRAELIPD